MADLIGAGDEGDVYWGIGDTAVVHDLWFSNFSLTKAVLMSHALSLVHCSSMT